MVDFAIVYKTDSRYIWQDQKIENRDFALISGKDELIQHLAIKLRFVFGEWFLDSTKGVKYFELIFVKNPDKIIIDREFKRCILKTDGIKKLLNFKSEIDKTKNVYKLKFTALSKYGELNFENTLLSGVNK